MWFWLALGFALVSSISTLILKVTLKKADEYLVAWLSVLFNLPYLFLILVLFFQIPRIESPFIWMVLVSAGLDFGAWIFSLKSLKMADISLVAPISAFNPVFTTLFSFFLLGEAPSARGLLGIIVVVSGAYLLRLDLIKKGILEPIKQLVVQRGLRLAMLATLIWSITPIFQKKAIFATNPQTPVFVSLISTSLLTMAYFPLVLKKTKKLKFQIKSFYKIFLVLGLLGGVGATLALTAFRLTNLGYVSAIFKLSMIFNVTWGHLFLKEKNIKSRLLGALVMFIGMLLIIS